MSRYGDHTVNGHGAGRPHRGRAKHGPAQVGVRSPRPTIRPPPDGHTCVAPASFSALPPRQKYTTTGLDTAYHGARHWPTLESVWKGTNFERSRRRPLLTGGRQRVADARPVYPAQPRRSGKVVGWDEIGPPIGSRAQDVREPDAAHHAGAWSPCVRWNALDGQRDLPAAHRGPRRDDTPRRDQLDALHRRPHVRLDDAPAPSALGAWTSRPPRYPAR